MASPGDAEGVTTSMGDLSVEATPSSSVTGIAKYANGGDVAAEDDDVWDDASDSPGHTCNLDREWIHRQNQFQKMGYRDGITEGQKDSAQEGFNVGFRQSVNVGYKWGLVRGVTSALSSLPNSLKEKLVPDSQCRSKLQDVHSSAQEISADESLQMFHKSICQSNHPSEESHVTSTADGATQSNRIKSLSQDLVLLLHECPDIKVVLVIWLLSVIGNFCSSMTIAYIGTIALVTIPALSNRYQGHVDRYAAGMVHRNISRHS